MNLLVEKLIPLKCHLVKIHKASPIAECDQLTALQK